MTSDSSNSSKGGNTKTPLVKQISPAKRWCFVLNNYTEDELTQLVPKFQKFCKKWIWAKEVGESGTPHIQGFCEFKTKKRPISVFENKRMHFDKANGMDIDQVIYCSKEGSVIESVGLPDIPEPLEVIDPNRPFQQEILEIIKGRPCDRTVYWYFGDGNIGKTQFCKYLSHTHKAICLHGKGADVRNGIVTEANRVGSTPKLVVFPIPKSYNKDYLSYEALENIKDMYFYSGKYEGGMINGNPPHLFVFANEPPDISKMSKDRWKVFHINKKTYKTTPISNENCI